MSNIFEWSDNYIEELCKINPVYATILNNHNYDNEWPDFSYEGIKRYSDFLRQKFAEVQKYSDDSFAYYTIYNKLKHEIEYYDNEEYYYDIGSIDSTFQIILLTYDQTIDKYKKIRYKKLPKALKQYQDLLMQGVKLGKVVPKRQINQVIEDCYKRKDLRVLRKFGKYLKNNYLPYASDEDGVGAERYKYHIDKYAGYNANVDINELYEWGYSEIERLSNLMNELNQRGIEKEYTYNKEEFKKIIEDYEKDAYEYVKDYFDLPANIGIPEIVFDPLNNFAANYIEPSDDFKRKGRITYPENFPLDMTQEMTTAFHEGFPGHHLQLSLKVLNKDNLTSFQRLLSNYPVYEEGWALYSEQLMVELGYYKDKKPIHLYGKYQAEMLRSCRIVIDIGIHNGFVNKHTGKKWDFDQMVYTLMNYCGLNKVQATSESLRYCHIPFQAVTYKLGCREILRHREKWLNEGRTINEFHSKLLGLGCPDLAYMNKSFETESVKREVYTCKNDFPFIKRTDNSSFNHKDVDGVLNIILLISIIILLVLGFNYSSTFNIYYKFALFFMVILALIISIHPMSILYIPSSVVTMNTRTPEFLDKDKFFPNYVNFENENTFRAIKSEVQTIIDKTDNGNTLKLVNQTFGGQNNKIGSDVRQDGEKTRGWRLLPIKVGDNYIPDASKNFPELVKVLNNTPEVVSCAISILEKGVKIPIHVGYYKGIIRYMLPIIVPKDRENVFLCVNEIKYNWTEGVGVLFDDTFPHKVYNNTDEIRVVVYMDVKRPLNNVLTPINDYFIRLIANSGIAKKEVKKTEIQVKL